MFNSWRSHGNALIFWEALDRKSLHVDQIHTNFTYYLPTWASLVALLVKNLPAVQETQVRSLGWEDLEKGTATHSSVLAWRIPWTEEPGKLHTVQGVEKRRTQLSD